MRWPWTKTEPEPVTPVAPVEQPPTPISEPAPVAEPVPREAPEPASEHDRQEEQVRPEPATAPSAVPASSGPVASWPWLTPTRIMVAAAALPSLLSLVWVATTVAEITAGPEGEMSAAGLATGVFADVLIVSTVLIGWFMPSVRTQASIGGWIAAGAASLLLGWHYWGSEQLFFAAVPLAAKFLWHLALQARTAAEAVLARRAAQRAQAEKEEAEKAALAEAAAQAAAAAEAGADDAALTVDQRRTIADLKREAAFAKAKADAEAERERARIEAENTVDMATDRAEAERLKARYDLAAQVGGRLPIQVLAQFLPELPGVTTEVTEVHRDRSQISAAPAANGAAEAVPAGFGAALSEAQRGIGGIGVDLGGRTAPQARAEGGNGTGGIGGTGRRPAHHEARRAAGQVTRQRVLEAIEEHGRTISTNELAELLELGRTTVRDHRKALAKEGKNVWPEQ
ncbi:winged helix-turn-helix domain-containing protein [Nocardiopsis sp. JB363]|uniref:winged helix-turn-helix domain-containing protein n=1 Tax=Nocardiopsis sp. JB363 TaxID=1434837 RepID=UPI000979D0D8|nr:winged helix-turn-helix domain-containing protein [Nocardiopsis sp. JB363]SIO86163.1 hypothetical protein BQ8420_10610 [Nocardiopsis sp. JB363]